MSYLVENPEDRFSRDGAHLLEFGSGSFDKKVYQTLYVAT